MVHRGVQWPDQSERPLRGVNVAEILGDALRRSLVLVTLHQEESDRRIGEYLDARCLMTFECSVEQQRARRWSAKRVPANIRSAASYFVSRVEGIPDVLSVTLEIHGAEARVLTYIRRRDKTVRSEIYAIERDVYEIFPDLVVDFRVVSLDTAKCILPDEDGEGTYVLFRR